MKFFVFKNFQHSLKSGMILWNLDPLKCNGFPDLPFPFSPVQRARKFSTVRGTTFLLRKNNGSSLNIGNQLVELDLNATGTITTNADLEKYFGVSWVKRIHHCTNHIFNSKTCCATHCQNLWLFLTVFHSGAVAVKNSAKSKSNLKFCQLLCLGRTQRNWEPHKNF